MMNRISAKIVADSMTPQGDRLTTLEVVMPRFILAEFNTHRMFSRNSASSRAIPFQRMVRTIKENPFIPIAWQKEHKGMQGSEYITDELTIKSIIDDYLISRDMAIERATNLSNHGVTKQLANRQLEPFMYHKVLVSATEWENFFNLRCPQYQISEFAHDGKEFFKSKNELLDVYPLQADNTDIEWLLLNKGQGEIHIMDLAEKIYDAMNESTPKQLKAGEWHIPYGDDIDLARVDYITLLENIKDTSILEVKIATARAARLSYQTLGDDPKIDYMADLKLHDILLASGHLSPFEHCAQVMTEDEYYTNYSGILADYSSTMEGYSPEDKDAQGWSGNFRGFIQYRKMLEYEQRG